jgi:hypothetical protein
MRRFLPLRTPVAKLTAYGLLLVAAFGGGAAVGAAFGPEPSNDHPAPAVHDSGHGG